MNKILLASTIFFGLTVAQGQTDNYPGLVKLVIGTHKLYCKTKSPVIIVTNKNAEKIFAHCTSDTVVFKFYKSPTDNIVTRQLSFFSDEDGLPKKERIVEKDYHSWLHPISFNDDTTSGYFNIYFSCKEQKDGWYKIIINEQTQETMWIKNKRFVKLLKWKALGKKEIVCLQPKTKLYSKPDSSSTAINFSQNDYFEIVQTKGSWMKAKARNGDPCGNSTDKIYFAWFNFKSKDKLLFDILIW